MILETGNVRRFMQAFGQETPDWPKLPDLETRRLRFKLIVEEAKELEESKDIIEYLDAVSDLLYVVLGSGVAAGFDAELMERAFALVHQSNMTKFWLEEEVFTMPSHWTAVKADGLRYIVMDETGKVRKSPTYQAVNLSKLIK